MKNYSNNQAKKGLPGPFLNNNLEKIPNLQTAFTTQNCNP